MSFLLQRASGRSLTLTQVSGSALRIGRGTNQELRSENPAVALEHAVIESDAAGYFITDKGSITGTYVNRKPVENARLAKGDVIEIGDLRIEVQIADAAKPLFLRIAAERAATGATFEDEEQSHAVVAPGARVVRAKKVDYAEAYRLQRPWLTRLSVTAIVLIVTLTLIGLIVETKKQSLFMPGGLSSAHARARDPHGRAVAANCDSCHSPFRSVSSNKCMDCHPQQPHALEARDPDCFSCHAEHRGATKLAAIGDATCVSCHAGLGVTAFGEQHPDLAYPRDENTLRFNHELHLAPRGVFNAQGKREVLECAACHVSSSGFLGSSGSSAAARSPAPPRNSEEPRNSEDPRETLIPSFEQHCQRCHRLTFDARFPDAEVPHGGDPGIVYGFVGGMYSGDRELAGKSAAELRRLLTTRRSVSAGERATLNAEQVIKTKCRQCHEVARRAARLAVTPPVLRTSWLNGRFTHARHATVECEQCHQGVRGSVATADVLMPKTAECTGCHGPRGTQAASACLTCHEYHHRPQRQVQTASLAQAGLGGIGSGGRMLQGILLALIVILLLVVLVPVGIALFQRLKPERAAAPQPRPAPPPPPRRVQADAPTDKVERQSAPPPPDIAPQPPAPPPAPAVPTAPQERTTAPAGTEMVQWNGMLHCTKGPLEGQRFIIDDDGFYIGRDPSLAKIVIPDSRVSKRHVRILPRDGKVWAIDEGSTNGTFLKGQRITEVQLKRGDALVLGDDAATFVYQI